MIHIACGCDDNYARHTAVMLATLSNHLDAKQPVTVHLLHDEGLAEKNINRLRLGLPQGFELFPRAVSASQMKGLPIHRFNRACWHRVFLPELLQDIDKVIYLDSDMVILDDIKQLWDMDISAKLFGAVTNPLYPFNPPHPITTLGLSSLSDYLNTGCMYMNLSALREDGFVGKIKKYAESHPENAWPEQDAISALYEGRWLKLHPRWNVQNTFFELKPEQIPLDKALINDALEKPAIIHFIGMHKPWHYLCRHPFRRVYLDACKQTSWPEPKIEGRTVLNYFLRPLPLRWQLRILRRMPDWMLKILGGA